MNSEMNKELKNQLNSKKRIEREIENKNIIEEASKELSKALDNMKVENNTRRSVGEKKHFFSRVKGYWKSRRKTEKYLIILLAFLILSLIPIGLVYVWWTGVDSALFKSTLSGQVLSVEDEVPLENVEIYIEDEYKTKTDEAGNYKIGNLNNGKAKIRLEKNGYEIIEKTIAIGRYSSEKDFEMVELPKGELVFQLDLLNRYDPSLISISLDGERYEFSDSLEINIPDLYKGEHELLISSPEFVDISKTVDINAGTNELADFDLVAAADIIGNIENWINDESIDGVLLNGFDDEYSIENGQLKIVDFTGIDKLYNLTFTKEGFVDQTKERRIVMGTNDLGNIFLYPDSKVVYKDENSGNLFSTYMDGDDNRMVASSFESLGDFGIIGAEVYYLVKDSPNSIRKVSINGGSSDLVSLYGDNLETLFPSFRAKLLVNMYQDSDEYVLQYGELTGQNMQEFYRGDSEPNKIVISSDGSTLFYTLPDGAKKGLYYYSTEYGSTRKLVNTDVSLRESNDDGSYVYYVKSGKLMRMQTQSFREFEVLSYSPTLLVYGGDKLIIANDGELIIGDSKVTTNGAIKNMYVENDILVYSDSEGVKLLDIANPVEGKIFAH